MKTDPIAINGVAGAVVVTTPVFFGHPTLTVEGQPAPRIRRRQYQLPATYGGTIDATVRTAFTDPYPSVVVNGVQHRTGPKVPVILRVLALLPFVLIVGGVIGGLFGALGFITNLAVARTQLPSVAKAPLMIGTAVAAFLVWFAVAAAVLS
jgi:hypothetical protein